MTLAASAEARPLVLMQLGRRRIAAALGLGMLGLAALALLLPKQTTPLLGVAGGWLLWMAGALMLGFALVMFASSLRLVGVLVALVAVGLGAFLTFNPMAGALAAALLLTAALVADASFHLAVAFHLRPLKVWRWMLASALTSFLAALLLALGPPLTTPDAVALLLAAALGSSGIALIALNFAKLPAHH